MKGLENDGARHEQSRRLRNSRCGDGFFLFFFLVSVRGWGWGGVITVSFQSPVKAPAPDSAVNHGRLMRLGHTHPIPTHKHKPGDSLQLEAGPAGTCHRVSCVRFGRSARLHHRFIGAHRRFGCCNVIVPSLTSKHRYLILLSILLLVLKA